MTFSTRRSEAAHPRSPQPILRPCATLLACAALLLALLPAVPAAAGERDVSLGEGIEAAADPGRFVRVPLDRLANFDRLRQDLSTEATVEDLLEAGDRRDLTAVRAWVQRCRRVDDCELQDNPHDFDDGRSVLQAVAKESLRDYVKQQVRWSEMQDRMRVRVRNFFVGGGERSGDRSASAPSALSSEGAFEFAPQVDLDLDDTELGVDFRYAPVRYGFLADWELSYREHVQRRGRSLRLRYESDERWFDLTTAMHDDYLGNYVGVTITQLF